MLIYNRSEDRMRRFLLLAHLEFTSDRKRMSVLVQDETGAITLLTKGADNLVSKLLNPTTPHLKETQNHINSFSSKGLRTLMLAKRVISAEEYRSWRIQYDRAACSLHDREKLLSNCYDLI
jgi:magnesium-transporting ATPase (P-type)